MYYLVPLVEAYGRRNQPEEGLALSTRALAAIDEMGERTHEAELYRLRGELTLQQLPVTNPQPPTPNTQDTEACFHKAIEVARKQHAKSLELRAVMSLARLWQRQGKKAEARQRLAEIYGWFTEGFDAKDLQEAKALLDELS